MRIETIHLFPVLDLKLIELLRSLTPREWKLPSRARLWTVKDIVAHLLDGNLRTLSMSRDQYFGEAPTGISSHQDLVSYLNRLNADWVKACQRVSPAVLIDLLELSSKQYHQHLSSLDPEAKAIFSVGWAGEQSSKNWFHIAREYTEKWHHQQQIREVVHQPGIQTRELYYPVLDTFMRALPHHYATHDEPLNYSIVISIHGEAGGKWGVIRNTNGWTIGTSESPDTIISLDQDVAWKLLTKGLTREEATRLVNISGSSRAGTHFLSMLSVMA